MIHNGDGAEGATVIEDKATEVPVVVVAEVVVDPPRSCPSVRVRLGVISEVVVVEGIGDAEIEDAGEVIEDEVRLEEVVTKAPGYIRQFLPKNSSSSL